MSLHIEHGSHVHIIEDNGDIHYRPNGTNADLILYVAPVSGGESSVLKVHKSVRRIQPPSEVRAIIERARNAQRNMGNPHTPDDPRIRAAIDQGQKRDKLGRLID